MTDHLAETVSDRGLRYFPPIPATYAGRKDGEVEVHESSAAEEPALWLKVTAGSGASQTVHLHVDDAHRLAEQLVALAGEVGRDWGAG